MPNQLTLAFTVNVANTSYGPAKAAAAIAAVPLYNNQVNDPVLGQFFGLTVASDVSAPAPAVVVGTVDLTTLTYGPGGSLDGLTFMITEGVPGSNMNTTFAAPANPAAVIAQLNATVGGPPHPLFTSVYTAFINGANQLVVNAAPTPTHSFTISGTALAVLGMTAGSYSPAGPVTRTIVLNMTSVPGTPTAPPPSPCNPITATPPVLPYPLLTAKKLPGHFLTVPGSSIVNTSDSQVPSLVGGSVDTIQFLSQPGVFYRVFSVSAGPPPAIALTANYSGPFSKDGHAVLMIPAPATIAAIYSTSPLDSAGVAITPALPAGSGAQVVSLSYMDSTGAGPFTVNVSLRGKMPSLVTLHAGSVDIAVIIDMHVTGVGFFGNSVGQITLCELSAPPPYMRADLTVDQFADLIDQTQLLITRGLTYLPPSYFALAQQGANNPPLTGEFLLPGRLAASSPLVRGGTSVATTVSQVGTLSAGNVISFAAQPDEIYTIAAVGPGTITLTSVYRGLNDNPLSSSATLVTPSPASVPTAAQLNTTVGEFVNPGTAVPPPNRPLAPQTMSPSPTFLSGLFARTLQLAMAVPVVPSAIVLS